MLTALTMLMLLAQMRLMLLMQKQALNFHLIQICLNWKIIAYLKTDVGAEADINNLDTTIQVSPIPTTRIHKDHPLDQVIGDLQSAPQTRRMSKNLEAHGFVGTIQQRTNHKDLQNCLFACFLSQEEPKKIEEEVYVCQPPGFEDPNFPDIVYKVEKSTQKKDGIFICQDKYVDENLKKFGFTEVKTTSTPIETQKPLLKDEDGEEVDVYMYRSMIGSLMYITSSRPCQPKLGLWYPKDSPFDLVAYTDSDYAGAVLSNALDRQD
ncbi:hypothetical protein Tco_0598247 [Tanacetum coccineum]